MTKTKGKKGKITENTLITSESSQRINSLP